MKLYSRETLYRARSTFNVSNEEIPSFGFSAPKRIDGFVTQDARQIYFGCLKGVYSENPTKTDFQYGCSWESTTQVLSAYFALPDTSLFGLRISGTPQDPVATTLDVSEPFNGLHVESFTNRTIIRPARFICSESRVDIEPLVSEDEHKSPVVDRLVNQHIDIILDKLFIKAAF